MKDLAEILKYAPRGLKLYSLTIGPVEFMKVNQFGEIVVFGNGGKNIESFSCYGRKGVNGECLLFPDTASRSWDTGWQDKLFRNGDFITTGHGTRIITDLENRRCVSPVGDIINFIIGDNTRWASPTEISNFMKSLEQHGCSWDGDSLSVKRNTGQSTEDEGFTRPLNRKVSELTGRVMELPCVSSDSVHEILTELGNWVKDGMVEDLTAALELRIQELQEIKSREEGHGITTTDLMSITGGIQEIQILLEKLRNSK